MWAVISTGNIPMIFLTSTLITAGTYAMSNAIYPAWIVAASSVLAVAGALWARETSKKPLRELGNPVR